MIRVRFYPFALSLPLILVAVAVIADIAGRPSPIFSFNFSSLLFGGGVALQCLFALMFACPKCGKSPYTIGPSFGPFALAGKPFPDQRCGRCGYDLAGGQSVAGH